MAESYSEDNQGFYNPGAYNEQQPQGTYDMGTNGNNGQDMQFGQFDYSQQQAGYAAAPPVETSAPYDAAPPTGGYAGSIFTPDPVGQKFDSAAAGSDNFDDEPPLMEELGINFDHIVQKTLAVLNPFKGVDNATMQDTDLAGPFVFCLAFGGTLLLAGKVQFGYIYGIGVVGCLAMYALLNLMSMTGVTASQIISVLGYCLLPMVLLSAFAAVISLQGILGTVLTGIAVVWCAVTASKLFVTALAMDQQQLLVAYPCALVYGVFALLTVF